MKWIADPGRLAEVVRTAGRSDVVAFDTEADSLHSYFEKVCLIQLSTADDDYLIDPLAVDPAPLGEILADSGIRKIFHGADYDLRILNRDFGFVTRNLVDTMICAQLLGESNMGLAALLLQNFGIELDKSHQRADWSKRPLSEDMKDYAAKDTRHLVQLAGLMQNRLTDLGRWDWALEEFTRLEDVRWTAPDDNGERFRRLKGAGRLDRRRLGILSLLHEWRDGHARKRDVPPFKVIGNDALVALAEKRPADPRELARVHGVAGYHQTRYGDEILAVIERGNQLPADQLPERRVGNPRLRDRRIDRLVDRMKSVRDQVAADLGIDASVLAPKHLLLAVATMAPATVESLWEIPAARRWQINALGARLLHIVRETDSDDAEHTY